MQKKAPVNMTVKMNLVKIWQYRLWADGIRSAGSSAESSTIVAWVTAIELPPVPDVVAEAVAAAAHHYEGNSSVIKSKMSVIDPLQPLEGLMLSVRLPLHSGRSEILEIAYIYKIPEN